MALDQETFSQLTNVIERFVEERLIPLEAEVSESDQVPAAVVNDMRELGLFGLSIPEQYGGLGLSVEEEVRIIFELGHTSPAFRSVFGTNTGIGSQGIVMDGTDEQKRKYLPKLASGEIIGSFALTEPDSGSDAASLRTTAKMDGNEYVLNGTKRFITNAPSAGLFTVMARTDPEKKGASGISAFLVEADSPGLKLGPSEKKMGQQGAHVCDVIFEDCRIPADNLVGGEEHYARRAGFKGAMRSFNATRPLVAIMAVGIGRAALDESLAFAREHDLLGLPRVRDRLERVVRVRRSQHLLKRDDVGVKL